MSKTAASVAFLALLLVEANSECGEKVRLAGLGLSQVGWVEMCEGGQWVSVCVAASESSWRHSNAVVACRELGYSSGVALSMSDRLVLSPGNVSSHMTSHVICSGAERSLAECSITEPTSEAATCKGTPAIVMCTNTPGVGSVRLVQLMEGTEDGGVVEVFTGRQWVTVCTDGWGVEDSSVVCRQLGYSTGHPTYTSLHPRLARRLSGKKLNHFQCSGNESSLLDCRHTAYSRECVSTNYASVTCEHSTSTTEADCPGLSLNTVMIFVTIQLGNLLLTTAIYLIILVAWRRWRNSKQHTATDTSIPREIPSQQLYHAPPPYSDTSRDTLLEPSATPQDNQ